MLESLSFSRINTALCNIVYVSLLTKCVLLCAHIVRAGLCVCSRVQLLDVSVKLKQFQL